MSTVTIRWSATHEEDVGFENPFAVDMDTILFGSWADCPDNGDGAVKDCLEDYFDEYVWLEEFGNNDTQGTVLVEVQLPLSIAGRYEVNLERVVKAHATKLETARAEATK